MGNSPTPRIPPTTDEPSPIPPTTDEPSPTRRMNNQEWKDKVNLLKKREEKLYHRYWKLEKNALREELNSLGEAIGQCVPILERARKERSTVWELLKLIYDFDWRFTECDIQTCQRMVDSLNRFAVAYEDWQKVEAYAEEETETVDFELHAMAVVARKIVCKIERKIFEINSKLQAPPTSGQFIVHDHNCTYYRSAFGLTQGVHFFETVVLECSHWGWDQGVTIGWSTRLLNLDYGEWIYGKRHRIDEENSLECTYEPIDDQHSIGFEGPFPSGTVLGCLLNFPQRTFAFYVNGRKVVFEKFTKKVPLSCNAYYIHAKRYALLYFNFGQVPFKYPPPPEIADYPTTDLANQANRYTLYDDVELMPLFDNQVEPIFTDAKQRKVKETLEQLWKESEIRKEKVEETYTQAWKEETFHLETYVLRWMQAILEMENGHSYICFAALQSKHCGGRNALQSAPSLAVLTLLLCKAYGRAPNVDEGKVNDLAFLVVTMVDFFDDETWDLLEYFIAPYSKLRVMVGDRWTMYRTLTILFATLLQYDLYYGMYLDITPSLSSFLLSAFLTTTDPSTAMFTLIGLERVKEDEEKSIESPIMQKLKSKEFTEKLQEWKGTIENTRKMTHSLAQFRLVIHHFEHSLPSFSAPHPATPTPASLSPSACSSQAKLSSDCLSLRSDFKWQSACSHLSVDNSLSLTFPIFYFEATLLTSGPMRIGWATQRWQVNGSKLGDSEFSFGYDGHTGCIWHQDVQWRVGNAKQWQAGDVIGCQLDLANQQSTFYQNGERIQLNGDIYSRVSKKIEFLEEQKIVHVYERNDSLQSITPFISVRPYQAALSLGPYQQVTVNFGHTFFRFPPKCLDFWDFQQYSEQLKVHEARLKLSQFSIGSATNAIITIGSKTTTGNVSMNQSVPPSNPTTEPCFIILEKTVCQVCKQETKYRRRTLENCPHLAFCVDCSSKDIKCKEC